jgi:hypothetical protein
LPAVVSATPAPSWLVKGIGDYNGAGLDNILPQNANGVVAVWEVSGTQFIDSSTLGNPGPTWHV